MNRTRFSALSARFSSLKVALIGDFCLDRYLEIDPERKETSIETGLPVHNVVRVRAQPGASGTILNNLVALGVGQIYPVGFCGVDGEGFELQQALRAISQVRLPHFLQTEDRRTFTYCKPLIVAPPQAPVELNRLDSKNWTPTPVRLRKQLSDAVSALGREVDAMILLEQVDQEDTGVITPELLGAVAEVRQRRPDLVIIADSRRGLGRFPPVGFKMNLAELGTLSGAAVPANDLARVQEATAALARQNRNYAFVTMAENGICGADATGRVERAEALPVRGPIDIVGAGDAVTANLTVALASGATVNEALRTANAAASVVIHQLGTTGTANSSQIAALLPA